MSSSATKGKAISDTSEFRLSMLLLIQSESIEIDMSSYSTLPKEEIDKHIRKVYYELVHRQDIVFDATKSFLIIFFITIVYTLPALFLLFYLEFPYKLIFLLGFAILACVLVIYWQKIIQHKLTYKESIIIRLCGVSGYLLDATKLETGFREIDGAKIRNKFLIDLLAQYTAFLKTYDTRGLTSEDEFRKLLGTIKKLAEFVSAKTMEEVRDDEKITKIAESYRIIAYLIEQDKFNEAHEFIETTFDLNKDRKLKESFKKFASNNILRILVSSVLVILLLIVIFYFVRFLGLLTNEMIGWYTLVAIPLFFVLIKDTKSKVDNIVDVLTS